MVKSNENSGRSGWAIWFKGLSPMRLTFPNTSRSYDASARRIRFLGHDGMFEIPFFVQEDVFSGANSEATYLAAFDKARSAIETVARKAYAGARRPIYVLTASDFHR